MTISMYLQCFIVAVLGMALQTGLKIQSLQNKARIANQPFKVIDYFKQDWLSIILSLLTIIIILFVVDEVLKYNDKILNYIKLGFAFSGYTGSDIISRIFSVANKKLNTIIDYKTDVADGKIIKE